MISWHLLIILLSFGDKLSESAILRIYPDLEAQFMEQRQLHKQDIVLPVKPQPMTDPFALNFKTHKVNACKELVEATAYYMMGHIPGIVGFPDFTEVNLPYNALNSQITSSDDGPNNFLAYKRLAFWINNSRQTVFAFLCAQIPEAGYDWYLTYGYDIADKIVLQITPENPVLHVLGTLEQTPFIDPNLYSPAAQSDLEMKFLNSILSSDTNFNSQICSGLDKYKQFYLCTAVYDAWREVGQETQRREYYVKLRQNECVHDKKLKLLGDFTDVMANNEILVENMLPCAIHREWDEPGFYVVPDPAEEFAVYIVIPEDTDGYLLVAHVTNIMPLKSSQ